MAILTFIVIATLIIAGAYVGYHAWEDSLHEEPEAHSINLELNTYQFEKTQSNFNLKNDLKMVID